MIGLVIVQLAAGLLLILLAHLAWYANPQRQWPLLAASVGGFFLGLAIAFIAVLDTVLAGVLPR